MKHSINRLLKVVKGTFRIQLLLYLLVINVYLSKAQEKDQTLVIHSFTQLQKLVCSKNPDLQSYYLNQEKMEIELKRAKSYRLPSITGNIDGQKNLALATTPLPGEIFGQPGTTVNAQFGQEYTYNAGISINKSILDRQAVLNKKMAELDVELTDIQTSAFVELLDQQTALYYYAALVAKSSVSLWEKDLQVADSTLKLVQQRYEQGLVNALTYNQARINVVTIKQNLNSGKQFYAQNENELKKLLAYPPEAALLLEEEPRTDLPEIYALDQFSLNQEITLAEVEKRQAETQVKLQKSALIPKLSLNAYLGWQQFRDDFGLDFGDDAWNGYRYVGVNLSIPIFTGFSNKNKIKASKIELERTQNDLQNQRNLSDLADSQLILDYQASLQNTDLAKDALELYQENSELTYQQYQEGLVSLDRYLSVFEDYLQAENSFLNTLLDTYHYYSQIIPRIK